MAMFIRVDIDPSVQQDAALTAEQLAAQVSLSPSAIQRRLKRLREQGVIVRQVALVDPALRQAERITELEARVATLKGQLAEMARRFEELEPLAARGAA